MDPSKARGGARRMERGGAESAESEKDKQHHITGRQADQRKEDPGDDWAEGQEHPSPESVGQVSEYRLY